MLTPTEARTDAPATGAPDRTLDVSGLLCPLPVLRAARVMRELPPGERLEIIASDPGTWNDIPALCSRTGHRLLSRDRGPEGVCRFLVVMAPRTE